MEKSRELQPVEQEIIMDQKTETEKEHIMQTGIKPQVIREIRELAEKYGVEKVILFGSRARGDYKERSDIDLAFSGGNGAAFSLDVDEETSTQLMFDLIDLSGPVMPELEESIRREGVLIYEKS